MVWTPQFAICNKIKHSFDTRCILIKQLHGNLFWMFSMLSMRNCLFWNWKFMSLVCLCVRYRSMSAPESMPNTLRRCCDNKRRIHYGSAAPLNIHIWKNRGLLMSINAKLCMRHTDDMLLFAMPRHSVTENGQIFSWKYDNYKFNAKIITLSGRP